MDIGHLQHVSWVKDDDLKSQINDKPELKQNNKSAAQNRWIAYNRMRGQYASAMEHAAPEAFWVDKTKCSHTDENGRIQNPTLNPCAEGISAVKAIAIAQAEGQKIYTINKQNAQTALQKLPIGGEVGSEIRNAVNAGKEVTVHEKSINKHGWKGFGYIVIDPETGTGAYIIEGNGNGGNLLFDESGLKVMRFFSIDAPPTSTDPTFLHATYSIGVLAVYSAMNTISEIWECHKEAIQEAVLTILVVLAVAALVAALTAGSGLPAAVLTALAIISTNANAALGGNQKCQQPRVRIQIQESQYCNNFGGTTFNTLPGEVIKGEIGVGVTIAQAEQGMGRLLARAAVAPWIPNKFLPGLASMSVQTLSKLQQLRPYGVSEIGNIDTVSSQQMYEKTCFRIDVDNLYGTNFKQ